MGCACGKTSSRSAASRQQVAAASNSGGAYVFEATYNDGTSQQFGTEQEVQAALALKGGGYRQVPRSG